MSQFLCHDAKKSIAFYRDVLGFEVEKSWPDESNPMWAKLMLDRQSVMVGQAQKQADPSGYQLVFYSPIKMESCQSCGMPLAEAAPGQMYCGHCTDESGALHPYDVILEGCIQGYFMGMQKMSREEAEPAARAHLAKMPAWQGRG